MGKLIRLSRIFRGDGRAVILAMDHGVEHGPGDFPGESINPRWVIERAARGGIDAVMATRGVIASSWDVIARSGIGVIVKVTGKTNLRPREARLLQSPIATVEDALALGADGVAATVYWGSPQEDAMLAFWTELVATCRFYGLPVLQLAYPRTVDRDPHDPEVVRYAARAAAEVGADIIKTYYTGSRETFRGVVRAAMGVPVLMSGGPRRDKPIDFLRDVEDVIAAGARGVVVGRNVFQSPDPEAMVKAIAAIVHEGLSAEEAARKYGVGL